MTLRSLKRCASWTIQHWRSPRTWSRQCVAAIIIKWWLTERLLRKLGRRDVQQIEVCSTIKCIVLYKITKTRYTFPPPTASSRQPLFRKRDKGVEAGTNLLKTHAQSMFNSWRAQWSLYIRLYTWMVDVYFKPQLLSMIGYINRFDQCLSSGL